jgi:hypothetical protein
MNLSAKCFFSKVVNSLETAKKHLDIIYDPFKNATEIPKEAVVEFRGAINRFKDQIKENFNKVKGYGIKAVAKLNYFSSDTHIAELVNAFKDSIGDLEDQVTILMDILDNYKDPAFKDNVLVGVEAVRKECFEVENLIEERIIDHIDANILAKDWITDTSDALKIKMEDKIPYVTQLFQERQKALESLQS